MGNFFSDPVEQALEDIYYKERSGRGRASFELLVNTAAAGDGDACCVLSQCLRGPQHVWSGHGFPEDLQLAARILRLAVEHGSGAGMLAALCCGELPEQALDLQAALDSVKEKAEGGDAFCQYMLGEIYLRQDFLRIERKNSDSFPSPEAYGAYLTEQTAQCEDWFRKALSGGMSLAAERLRLFYTQGAGDAVPPQPEKAAELWKTGAEKGCPSLQLGYAQELEQAGAKTEALQWYQQSAEGGQPGAWYEVGRMYFDGTGVDKDEAFACQCFEKELPRGHIGSHNLLGKACFYGRGVPQDYERAFQLLRFAYLEGNKGGSRNNWGVYYLGKCCFEGWGTRRDYEQARVFLEQMDWEYWDASYMLGTMYARGLGVPQDIKRGVEYLQKAGDHPEPQEELLKYKKNLFGKWVRR